MNGRVRLGREDDAALLPGIERSAARSFLEVPGLEWIADGEVLDEAVHLGRIRAGTCWVAVDGQDMPVGFLSAEAIAGGALHIHEMSVTETSQGQGVGRGLLTAAIAWAAAHDVTAVTLTTFREVTWNAPFYGRVGFEVLDASRLDARLAALLRKEVEDGFAEGARCAMRLCLDDGGRVAPVRRS